MICQKPLMLSIVCCSKTTFDINNCKCSSHLYGKKLNLEDNEVMQKFEDNLKNEDGPKNKKENPKGEDDLQKEVNENVPRSG